MTKVVETVSTKVTKDGAAKATILTVDFTGADNALIMAYAMQAIRVKVQGRWRQDGIPSAYTFIVKDNPVGVKVPAKPTVESTKAAMDVLTREERMALYKQLQEESQARDAADQAEKQENVDEMDEAELEEATKPE